ncbi:MAG: GNAT family N-acetyltransferase [Planctomycetota bacterium]
MVDNEEVRIIPLTANYAQGAAKLHIEGIHMGFISTLGLDFVTSLYTAIAEHDASFGYVALIGDQVVGFATFTTDLKSLYKSVVKKKAFKFMFLLARKMFSWQVIRKVFETLFYPSRIKKLELPEAEFLSMAVSPAARGHGLATRFVKKGFDECSQKGIKELKILAAEKIGPINAMYQKFGFKIYTQIENHGVVSNVYVVPTSHFSRESSS